MTILSGKTELPYNDQFFRQYELFIGEQGVDAGAVAIQGLQIDFNISRSTKAETDKATLTVYNLSEDIRENFLNKGKTVILNVHYGVDTPKQLFWGQLVSVSSQRSGSDLKTVLDLEDGGEELQQSLSHRTFADGLTVYHILKTLIEQDVGMAAVFDNGTLGEDRGLNKAYKYGRTIDGNTKETIRKICKENDLQFYVIDRIAYVNPLKSARKTQVIPVYTPESGLIGTPYRGVASCKTGKRKKDDNPTDSINAKVLLNSSLVPGGRVGIESSLVSGVHKIDKVVHKGSWRGNDWSTSLELLQTEDSEKDAEA